MRQVSRIVYFSTVTINCTNDVGDKSEESGIPEAKRRNCFNEERVINFVEHYWYVKWKGIGKN